uniref:Tuberoinfundibular peptide of 39 residues n=1 Tax=Vombatus ursinus TaxID=29139 RepID=A0A4X2KNQ9_VOMUR
MGGAAEQDLCPPQVMEDPKSREHRRRCGLLLLLLLSLPGIPGAGGAVLDWSLQLTGRAGPRPQDPAPSAGPQRRLVVADDAAFRERARLLAALERRRWLNSYMHKLLVVSDAAAD